MAILKSHHWHLVLASGGFTFFADYVKQLASLDEAHSNELEIIDGKLSGRVIGRVVDGEEKARILLQAVESQGVHTQQSIAMGDGANDLIMMAKAGLSLAYHAKPMVSAQADSAIRYCGFEGLLYALC